MSLHVPWIFAALNWVCLERINSLMYNLSDKLFHFFDFAGDCYWTRTNAWECCVRQLRIGNDHRIQCKHNYQLLIIFAFLGAFSYKVARGLREVCKRWLQGNRDLLEWTFLVIVQCFHSTASTQLKLEELKTNIYFPKKKLIAVVFNENNNTESIRICLGAEWTFPQLRLESFSVRTREKVIQTISSAHFFRRENKNERLSKYPVFYLSKYFSLIMSLLSCFNFLSTSESKRGNLLSLFPLISFPSELWMFCFYTWNFHHPDAFVYQPSSSSYLCVVHLCVGDRQRSWRCWWNDVMLLSLVLLIQSWRLIVDVHTCITIVD